MSKMYSPNPTHRHKVTAILYLIMYTIQTVWQISSKQFGCQ